MKAIRFFAASMFLCLSACVGPAKDAPAPGTNIVTVIGAIHSQHRRSERYSLEVLRAAIIKFDPDIIIVELPPDRFVKASANFDRFGEVRESRADDFPELTGVVFPLRKKLGFEMIPVAAWTQKIADDRRAAMTQIEKDPARAEDWSAHQAAIAAYNKAVNGRSDDPYFIHSDAYDSAVKARQESGERLFGRDLGDGGWQAINTAHFANITDVLDGNDGQEKRILILYGAWHKYWFLEALEASKGIKTVNAAQFFN